MAVVSVTRLHLRSLRFFLPFAWHTWTSGQQVRAAGGFMGGRFANEWPHGFWTLTAWESVDSMRAFRDTGPHRTAMRKLLEWCDEASFVHWEQDGPTLPTAEDAHARLANSGRTSKVHHPSPAHLAGRTTSSRIPVPGPLLAPRKIQ